MSPSRRVQFERRPDWSRSATDEDAEPVDLDALKQQRKAREIEQYEKQSPELDALRARIKAMAQEQELEEAVPWTPIKGAAARSDEGPEMTANVAKLASFLGDDRANDDEEEILPEDEYEDPIDSLPLWQALFAEIKQVEWPTPTKVGQNLLLIYSTMIVASLIISAYDTVLIQFLKQFYTFGTNPFVK